MEVVRFAMDGGVVVITITVDGPHAYRYWYLADDKKFRGDDTGGGEHIHHLGMPSELHLDSNRWTFGLGGPTGDSQQYEVKIVWEQDGHVLHEWTKPGVIDADKPAAEESGSAILAGE
ncbi:hypothetical protein KQH82_08050 [bacterium]|nr:hypothetical protein [bacterium]